MKKDLEPSLMKLPPHNIEAEEAVLGAMLISQNDLHLPLSILREEMFYPEKHRYIFGAIKALFGKRTVVDLLTVVNELRATKKLDLVGGPSYLVDITQRISSSANLEFHARIIIEQFIKREVIKISTIAVSKGFDVSVDSVELLEELQTNILALTNSSNSNKPKTLKQLVPDVMEEIENNMQNVGLTGIDTGLDSLNSIMGGMQNGLIVIGGRPGMGKTLIAVKFATHPVFKKDKVVMVFSLEMSDKSLACRIISSLSAVKYSNMAKGSLSEQDLGQIYDNIEPAYTDNLIIDETPSITITQIRANAMAVKMERGQLDMVVIDYLQLIKGEGKGNREQEISQISRGLKILSKELQIPVIALSQLGRAVESRGGSKRPTLSDLRESGAIEQDADTVMLLYRPEYYGIDVDENNESTKGKLEIIVAKQRNGALDSIITHCDLATNRVTDTVDELLQEKRYDVFANRGRNTELVEGYRVNYDNGTVSEEKDTPF